MAGKTHFSKATVQFFRDLKANNTREWFADNKSLYEDHVKDPALRFIEDFGPELKRISPHFNATPRSLFRIYRDTRFSKDKTPYKTAAGIHFRHEQSKDAHAPGFYLHIGPDEMFVAMGIWHPDSNALFKIRDHIADDGMRWKRASQTKKFLSAFALEGESLKRPPKGFDPEHTFIDDLKRKDFIGVQHVPQSFVTSPNLPERLAAKYRDGLPFMRLLCDALGAPF